MKVKYFFLILLIFFLSFLSFFTAYSSYYNQNIFTISLNGKEMNCYYTEKYNNSFLVRARKEGYNSVSNRLNEIPLEDIMELNVLEQEVYYKNGNRKLDVVNWKKDAQLEYKTVDTSKIQLEIKRMNKVLYKGNFKKDISKYINEKGRYYIHIYVTRKDGFFTTIKTHISFNVVVGGGNRA